jgi:hypothetical protein
MVLKKGNTKKAKAKRESLWDLYRDGLSQSLISKFLNDRERYRIYAVEGLRERGSRDHLEFGTIYHRLIEISASGIGDNQATLASHINDWCKKRFKTATPDEFANIYRLANIALVSFIEYKKWEKALGKKYNYFSQEEQFKNMYKLPSGRIIPLRGRFDEIIQWDKKTLWVQENKTKSRIDEMAIETQLPWNLQTMFYAVNLQLKHPQYKCGGIVYNVIRTPGERQKVKEPDTEFFARIQENIAKDQAHYFKRWEYGLSQDHLKAWEQQTLIPVLEHIANWWDSIKSNPFNPWVDADGNVNPWHFIRPFGVYDSMANGNGDYFDLICRGITVNLDRATTVFPELEDDDPNAEKE